MKASPNKSNLLIQHGLRIAIIVSIASIGFAYWRSPTLLSFLGVICFLWFWLEVSTAMKNKNLPPGDLGLFLLGDTLSFISDPIALSLQKFAEYGETFRFQLAYGSVVSTGDPGEISWIWNTERKGQTVGFWPPAVQKLLGPLSLGNQSGQFHRFLRRMLEPAFTPVAIRSYITDLDRVTKECLEKWSQDGDFVHSSVFKMYALQLFFVSAFGEVDQESVEQFQNDLKVWLGGFGAIVPLRIPGSAFAKAMNARENMLKSTEKLIKRFKKKFPAESDQAKKSLMGRICYAKDEDGIPMSMECLCDNMINIIFAGHHTTFLSMGTILYYLAQHPELQDAVRSEVKAFKDPLDFGEMKNSPVLNSFITECLRKDPPVIGGWREFLKQVDHPPFVYPAGQRIQYNIFVTIANEKVYPKPDKFSISRFLPKDHPLAADDSDLHVDNVDPKYYPVFGGGSRMCLGSHFAKLELRVFLTRLLQQYGLEIRNPKHVKYPARGWSHEFRLQTRAKQLS